ncbi:hypothetical protein HPB48_023387 [Haemaphysalis longicornis]|uniref:GH18 domain-containing protein n=1 Tax=Haemaphysalis longicornis TaxID=44386 RepID=A0A9J6H6U9_HAELO|nr:hypothetical protein HPB48_023387 [Haemaphysalis longicornis]
MKFWFLGSIAVVPVILPLLLLWLSYYVTPGAKRVTAGSSPALRNHSISMNSPTLGPTILRTKGPTVRVTSLPTSNPTLGLMSLPTSSSTMGPTSIPTSSSTMSPTSLPTSSLTLGSTRIPTSLPTPSPTPPLLTTEPPFSAGCGGEVPVEEPRVLQLSSPAGDVNFTKKAQLQNTFCIYNNTRVTEQTFTYFLPKKMPLTYCRHIVYWSVKVQNGTVGSRMPNFDGAYGLSKLRNLTLAAGNPSAIILAAVGGYPAESREFSLLGRDPDSMKRFVTSVRQIVSAYQLDGAAIHWVTPEQRCVDAKANATLEAILKAIRDHFQQNGLNVTIAVFLPADAETSLQLWTQISTHVDYAFIETQKLNPANGFDLTMCDNMSRLAGDLLGQFARLGDDKVCAGVSLAPWVVSGSNDGSFRDMSLAEATYGGFNGTGRAAVIELCRTNVMCKANTTGKECIAIKEVSNPLMTYLFPELPSLYTIVAHGNSSLRKITDQCLVLYDVDGDLYSSSCYIGNRIEHFLSLQHLIQAIDAPNNVSILRNANDC